MSARMKQPSLWEADRLTLDQAMALTAASLHTYGPRYAHWALAYSGGKDSTATVALVTHLIATGQVPAPQSLTVLYADTRMELPPLQNSALAILATLAGQGIQTQVVLPPMDRRFFVYMFGRGVPPPKNRFRWCTVSLKIGPMEAALADLRAAAGQKLLMLTGVRRGESAMRDARINISCSRDGAECGQGWFQTSTPESVADTLAPLDHFRVCHVWDLLTFLAPGWGLPTERIAEVYGGEEKEELNARMGCVGCNLVEEDRALNRLIRLPQYAYLAPLTELRPLYRELTKPQYRLRKDGSETRKDGSLVSNPMRMGPLTMDARRWGLGQVLDIQARTNTGAAQSGQPPIDLINPEEEARIHELIAANTWPNGWEGTEVTGDVPLPMVQKDGSVQEWLFKAVQT